MHSFDNIVLDVLAVFSVILFVASLGSFMKILPTLLACLSRWKYSLEIEDSHQLAGSRNWVAVVLVIPFCLLAYSYSLYCPDFSQSLPPLQRFAVVACAIVGYFLLRAFLNWQFRSRGRDSATFHAANMSFFNFFILAFLLLFLSGAVLSLFIDNEDVVSKILLRVLEAAYIIYLLIKARILSSVCNPFTTFLYLCALELLPTGALVLSAVLL